MEEVYIPDISTVLRTSKECIDRPATLVEILRLRCTPDNIYSTTGLLGDTLAKLTRHEKETKGLLPTTDLYDIVKELTLARLSEINKETNTNSSATPFILHRHKPAKYLRTIETIGNSLKKEMGAKGKELESLVKKHQNLTVQIQKGQMNCWISNSKANKYRLMVTTAQSSRKHLDGQLTRREANSRDKAIKDLQQTLKKKQEKADDDALAYCRLLSEEESMRQQIIKLSDGLMEDMTFEIMDRLESSLCDLNDLADAILQPDTRTAIQKKLMEVNVRKLASTVVSKGQRVYTYVSPTEYTKSHGFAEKIPIGKLLKKFAQS